jgi:hypothetical protein
MGWREDRDEFDIDLGAPDRSRRRGSRRDKPAKSDGWGQTAFMISIVSGVGLAIALIVGVTVSEAQQPQFGERDMGLIIFGIGSLVALVVSAVGLVLGAVTLVQTTQNNLFGILGTIFNALVLLGSLVGMCLGMLGHNA